jgi:hypothetical protein
MRSEEWFDVRRCAPKPAPHLHLHVHSPRLAHPDPVWSAANLASINALLARPNAFLARPNAFLTRPNVLLVRPNEFLAWGNACRLSTHRPEASLEANQTSIVAGGP